MKIASLNVPSQKTKFKTKAKRQPHTQPGVFVFWTVLPCMTVRCKRRPPELECRSPGRAERTASDTPLPQNSRAWRAWRRLPPVFAPTLEEWSAPTSRKGVNRPSVSTRPKVTHAKGVVYGDDRAHLLRGTPCRRSGLWSTWWSRSAPSGFWTCSPPGSSCVCCWAGRPRRTPRWSSCQHLQRGPTQSAPRSRSSARGPPEPTDLNRAGRKRGKEETESVQGEGASLVATFSVSSYF